MVKYTKLLVIEKNWVLFHVLWIRYIKYKPPDKFCTLLNYSVPTTHKKDHWKLKEDSVTIKTIRTKLT